MARYRVVSSPIRLTTAARPDSGVMRSYRRRACARGTRRVLKASLGILRSAYRGTIGNAGSQGMGVSFAFFSQVIFVPHTTSQRKMK